MSAAPGAAAKGSRGGAASATGIAQANLLSARALLEGLIAGGVRQVCLSPGSRSSPLALAVLAEPRLELLVQVDERSAAFLALGLAKGSGSPVALVCTSGTAAANYLPALAEASLSGVPLVALTADRPPELRDCGSAQTIDQLNLYGTHVRAFRDLPCPDEAGTSAASSALAAREACALATGASAGPVHLNVPFREPLVPAPEAMPACEAAWTALLPALRLALGRVKAAPARALPKAATIAALAKRLALARRPLIIAGPEAVDRDESEAVHALARDARVPVLSDIASGLRFAPVPEGAVHCAHADLALRDEALAALAPDFVLRLGGIPTSKALATWLARHRPDLVAIQPDARRRDPDGIVGEVVVAGAGALCEALRGALRAVDGEARKPWLALWRRAEAGAKALVALAPREAAAVVAACDALPAGGALFLSNSMPIRWAEMYAPARPGDARVFVNRGANGIDGIVSSAVGVAHGTGAPTLLVTGDLAFLHDAGGLRSARSLATPFAILLLDNDGGGIFSHLPIARHEAAFERLFGTPQGGDFAALSRAAGVAHARAATPEEVAKLVAQTMAEGVVRVIEFRTDRAQTAREQARVVAAAGPREEQREAGGLSWRVRRRGPGTGIPLVLLHGFTGTGEFWKDVALALPGRGCLAPDLPGHGGTQAPDPPRDWRFDQVADALVALLYDLGVTRFALAGYSMGGRLALGLALRHPARVAALALIGASPGIAEARERESRARDDLVLADAIEREGIAAFSARWEALPLFATQRTLPPALREAMRAQRLAQDPAGLANALRAFGPAFQPPAHERLAELAMPVLLMAGEADEKYARLAREMSAAIPGAGVRIVAGAGHAVPLERTAECARDLEVFLERSIDA